MSAILFDRIDEPGLNDIAVYEKRGGYEALKKALAVPTAGIIAVSYTHLTLPTNREV